MAAFGVVEAHASWGSWGGGSHGSWGGSRGYGSSGGSWGGGSRGWGSSGGSWGGSRGWGSSGGSWGGSSGGHAGPIRRMIHRHRSWGGSSGGSWGGSSGGSWGSSGGSRGYYSSGGSSGGYSYYSSSHGSHGYGSSGYGSSGHRVHYSTPVYQTTPQYYSPPIEQGVPVPATQDGGTPPPGPERTGTDVITDGDTALLNLNVPEDAVVYVNGRRTRTPGSFRSYVSRNLQAGKNYSYEIRAEVERDGEKLTRTKVVQLTAGTDKTLDIDFAAAPEVITSVTLFVPENATVKLGGVETRANGPTRFFSTTSLKEGDSWDNYEVTVTVDREGTPTTQTRTIDVNAGDSVNLRFDFTEDERVATR